MNKYEQFFRFFKLGNYLFKNCFVFLLMILSLVIKDGKVIIEEEKYLVRRVDCVFLLILGGIYFDDFGQFFEYGYSVKSDDDIELLKKFVKVMKLKGNIVILQLVYVGKFFKVSFKKYGYFYGLLYEKNYIFVEYEVFELSISQIK